MDKRRSMLTRASLAAVGLFVSSSALSLDIVRDGKAAAVIATPDNADAIVMDAAVLLAHGHAHAATPRRHIS